MIIDRSFDQGSELWREAKAGTPSSSNFAKIITTKGQPSKSAEGYMFQLVAELLLGYMEEGYQSAAMEEGKAREAESRALCELVLGAEIQQVGVVYKNDQKNVLCSPDGIIDGKEGLELKNPLAKTHIEYMLKDKVPTKYFQQLQGSLWVCGFDTYHFCSYFPGLPLFHKVVHRDEKFIQALETEMIKFLRELNSVYAKLKDKL